jgi:hypothetical protein
MCEKNNRERRDWLMRFEPTDTRIQMEAYLDSLDREDEEDEDAPA